MTRSVSSGLWIRWTSAERVSIRRVPLPLMSTALAVRTSRTEPRRSRQPVPSTITAASRAKATPARVRNGRGVERVGRMGGLRVSGFLCSENWVWPGLTLSGHVSAFNLKELAVVNPLLLSPKRPEPNFRHTTLAFPTAGARPGLHRPPPDLPESPVVLELEGARPVLRLDRRHDRLEVVLLLAGDPDLVPLDGRLDLEAQAPDELGDVLGQLGLEAALQGQGLADRRLGGRLDGALLEGLERDPAADELRVQDVADALMSVLDVAYEHDRLLVLVADLGRRPLEVETAADLLDRLLDGVLHLHPVDLGDDVEGKVVGHGGLFGLGSRVSAVRGVRGSGSKERGPLRALSRANRSGAGRACDLVRRRRVHHRRVD